MAAVRAEPLPRRPLAGRPVTRPRRGASGEGPARPDRFARGDRGMVTAELAAALPVLVLLLTVALSTVTAAATRVRALDAAREAARAAARGDTAVVRRVLADAAPGVAVQVSARGAEVIAVASARARLLGPLLPAVTVTERAVAAREPP